MKTFILSVALCLSACSQAAQTTSSEPHPVIAAHVAAFNAGDAAAMSKMQHPDIEWLSVVGSDVSIEVAGREALAESMSDYFKSPTKVTGTLRNWSVNGNFVSVTETASWTTNEGLAKSQSSVSVYELEDNLIRRVWYYPAVD